MSLRQIGYRHSNIQDNAYFPLSNIVPTSIKTKALTTVQASQLDSPAEVLRHLYFPKQRRRYCSNGSVRDVILANASNEIGAVATEAS